MIDFLLGIQTNLGEVHEFNYVDEDWGQLDDYSPHPPVKWPCVLIDIQGVDFSNIGSNRQAVPVLRQQGTGTIILKFANLKLTNSSGKAPLSQKQKAWSLLELVEEAHKKIQGMRPVENGGNLVRTSLRRIKRDDGIQQYQVIYSIAFNDV